MFERFTDHARRAIVQAQEQARALQHDHIGAEHILLALVHEPGSTAEAEAFSTAGITSADVQAQVRRIVGIGNRSESGGHIPFTPGAKTVLELSLREAMKLQHNYIGTEHITLGLLRHALAPVDADNVVALVLTHLGTTPDQLLEQVHSRITPGTDASVLGSGMARVSLQIALSNEEMLACQAAATAAGKPIHIWARDVLAAAATPDSPESGHAE